MMTQYSYRYKYIGKSIQILKTKPYISLPPEYITRDDRYASMVNKHRHLAGKYRCFDIKF